MFHFDLSNKKIKLIELEKKMLDKSFWDDPLISSKILKEVKGLKAQIQSFEQIKQLYEDIETLIEMGLEENEVSIIKEVNNNLELLGNYYETLRINTLLSGEYDDKNAILTLHAGAGGTESCDWVSMLLRMYTRWAEKKNMSIEVLDYLDGEEAGVKSVTIQVNGENAYGYLKSEKGVHRLVRISPFDASGRRHTSFASCDIMPEIDDDIEVDIQSDDLRIDTYRSSGAGGQHVNKTESAIRITHIPTGIVVQCQNERSQHKNKDRAMKMLKAKLFEVRRLEQMEKMQDIRGEVKKIGWGNQIRSYVMHPYSLVKDHRTNEETGNVSSILDGELDKFINAYLKWITIK